MIIPEMTVKSPKCVKRDVKPYYAVPSWAVVLLGLTVYLQSVILLDTYHR